MKKVLLPLLAAFPLVTLAAPPQPTPPDHPEGPPTAAQREEMEKHGRIMRVVGLAEELDLTAAEALRIDEAMRKFDERRQPLRAQVAEAAKVLERAANGDAAAGGQVDQAMQKIFDARHQLALIDREMYAALSKDLKPQQRAKMAVFFARMEHANKEMRMLLRERMTGGEHGMEPMGPGRRGPHGEHGMGMED